MHRPRFLEIPDGKPIRLMVCMDCGSIVADDERSRGVHEKWHIAHDGGPGDASATGAARVMPRSLGSRPMVDAIDLATRGDESNG